MQEKRNWRGLLKKILEDEKIHKHLAADLNVSPITLDRWANDESNPRMSNIRGLLLAPSLAAYREFQNALMEAYHIENNEAPEVDKSIPSELYEVVLKELTIRVDYLRTWGVIALCLNDMAVRLEANRFQVSYIVSQFVQATNMYTLQEKYIHSYQSRVTQQIMATSNLDQHSLPAIALTLGHDIVEQKEQNRLATKQISPEKVRSSAAFPLMRGGSAVGCFVVASENESYVTSFYRLLTRYIPLIALAFSDREFYSVDDIRSSGILA